MDMSFYKLLSSIDKYSDQFSVNMTRKEEITATLEASEEATLRAWYLEVFGGECSNDGIMGDVLAKTAPRKQLIEDLLFAAGE